MHSHTQEEVAQEITRAAYPAVFQEALGRLELRDFLSPPFILWIDHQSDGLKADLRQRFRELKRVHPTQWAALKRERDGASFP